MAEKQIDSLEAIWPLQGELNCRGGFDTRSIGRGLRELAGQGQDRLAGSEEALQAGQALKNYLDAMMAECGEMRDCLAWKHWYREAREGRQYEVQDLQNARVEAVDMLFFWVSLCQLLGLEPEDVYRLYEAKLGINHRRQDEDRSQAEHAEHEHENRSVR